MFGGLPQNIFEISGSEKCIFVDPGDGFTMDNEESKKLLGSDRGSGPPDPSPGSATVIFVSSVFYIEFIASGCNIELYIN